MGRLFLAAWLAVFALQSADLFVVLIPDDCEFGISESRGTDPCPDGCARCVCCRRAAVASPALALIPDDGPSIQPLPVTPLSSSAHPLDVFHIPKIL